LYIYNTSNESKGVTMKKIILTILLMLCCKSVQAEDINLEALMQQNEFIKTQIDNSKQSRRTNLRNGIPAKKASNLIGTYRINAFGSHYENLIIKNVKFISKREIEFTYDIRYTNNVLKIGNQIGAVIRGVIIFHSPIIDIHNVYLLNPTINRRGVSAKGVMNSFYPIIICQEDFTPIIHPTFLAIGTCGTIAANQINSNVFSYVTMQKI
jgi:hypothetical protein